MTNKTYLLIAPTYNSGHFASWKSAVVEMIENNDCQFYEITNETVICNKILDLKRANPVPVAQNSLPQGKNLLRDKLKQIAKALKVKLPRVYLFVRPAIPLVVKVLTIKKRLSNPQSTPLTNLQKAIEMSKFISGEIQVIHFYAEHLKLENGKTIEEFNQSQIPIHFFAFDLESVEFKKINQFSQLRTVGVSNEYSVNLTQKYLASISKEAIYELPDFPLTYKNSVQKVQKTHDVPIVLLIGDISERKSVELFLLAALADKAQKLHWRLVGQIHRDKLSSKSLKALNTIYSARPGNISIVDRFVSDDEFLSEISDCDFVFLMYKEWHWGSNVLTHAIYFQKKCVVFENSVLGNLIRDTNLSVQVKDTNTRELHETLSNNVSRWPAHLALVRYLEKHNRSEFQNIILRNIL